MVEIDFRAAVFPIPRSCTATYTHQSADGAYSGDPNRASSPVSAWLPVCCLTASGDDALGGARLSSDQSWFRVRVSLFVSSMLIYPVILTVSQAAQQQSSSLFQLKKKMFLLAIITSSRTGWDHYELGLEAFMYKKYNFDWTIWVVYQRVWWGRWVDTRWSHTSWLGRCPGSPCELSAPALAVSGLQKHILQYSNGTHLTLLTAWYWNVYRGKKWKEKQASVCH